MIVSTKYDCHCEPEGRGNLRYYQMVKYGLLRRFTPRNDDGNWSLYEQL